MDSIDDDDDYQQLAEIIEDGTYFIHARKWYDSIYIGPISERIYFIVITCISGVIFVTAVLALLYLLPIKPRIPFVYRAQDMVGEIPSMIRFKDPDEPSDPALIKYYLGTYVRMRESYSEDAFLVNRSFMKYYSDGAAFGEYNKQTHPSNPRSPIRRYGKYADVKVTLASVTYERSFSGPSRGTVNFSTEMISAEAKKKTDWTASIGFYYTNLVERDVIDERTGEITLDFDEPTFQVMSYDIRERLALPKQ